MSSKKQLAEQAETSGYRNAAHRRFHFTDQHRMLAEQARKAGRPPLDDPAALVTCGRCMETVMATRKRYFDTPEQLHRRQPEPQRYKRDDGQAVGV